MFRKCSGLVAALLATWLTLPAPAQTAQPAPAAAPIEPSALSVEAFAQLPFVQSPDLSPDGLRIAGLFGVRGEQRVGIIDIVKGGSEPVLLAIPEGTQATWVRWAGDSDIVVGLQALLPVMGERFYVSRAIAINRLTGKVTKLLWDLNGQNTADVLWFANDGTPDVLIAAQNSIFLSDEFWPTVYRVNVATGSRRKVQGGRTNVMDWNVDGAGNLRTGVSYSDDRRQFTLLYRGREGGSFKTVDRANTRLQEDLFNPILFLPGTDHALTIHRDEAGHEGVYEVDLLTRRDVRTVFTAPPGTEIERLFIANDGASLLGLRTGDGRSHWFDPALADLQVQLDKSVGERRARIVSFDKSRGRMLVLVDRPNSPGGIFYFDTARGTMHLFAMVNDALGARALSPVKLVRYAARDGTEIEAVLTLPKGREAKNLPIVLLPHGGPWARDTLDYDYLAQFVASRGYAVLQPNFRGSTGYGEAFERKGQGQMGLAMQDDITDALAWAAAQGIADPARACIVGASYGGYAAMWGAAKDPELYRCAISISGVSNLRADVNDFGSYLMGGKFKDDWKRMTPDFAAVSPINAVARIKAPLLLIHGKRDVTVDHDQSSKMSAKMKDAGKPVEFVSLPLADHYFTRQADRVVLLGAIERFLSRHNPAGPGPASQPGSPSSR